GSLRRRRDARGGPGRARADHRRAEGGGPRGDGHTRRPRGARAAELDPQDLEREDPAARVQGAPRAGRARPGAPGRPAPDRGARYVEVERGRPDLAVQAYERVKALLADGVPIVFFPEATFTQAAGLRPFRLGAFRVAAETGAPIVPIALLGTRRALPDRVWF